TTLGWMPCRPSRSEPQMEQASTLSSISLRAGLRIGRSTSSSLSFSTSMYAFIALSLCAFPRGKSDPAAEAQKPQRENRAMRAEQSAPHFLEALPFSSPQPLNLCILCVSAVVYDTWSSCETQGVSYPSQVETANGGRARA